MTPENGPALIFGGRSRGHGQRGHTSSVAHQAARQVSRPRSSEDFQGRQPDGQHRQGVVKAQLDDDADIAVDVADYTGAARETRLRSRLFAADQDRVVQAETVTIQAAKLLSLATERRKPAGPKGRAKPAALPRAIKLAPESSPHLLSLNSAPLPCRNGIKRRASSPCFRKSPGRATLFSNGRLRLLYLLYLSKPASDRVVYRAIRRQKPCKIVEIGMGAARGRCG